MTAGSGAKAPHSQTLDRGLRVLEVLADAERPMPIAELAEAIGVHRSIAYRIVRTLEDHRLVSRGADGACDLAVGLATLARNVSRDMRTAALPELTAVANELGMTSFLVVPDLPIRDGAARDTEECVALVSVEPRHAVTVAQRPGARHPIHRGAPGIALLAGRAPTDGEPPAVTKARRLGYTRSQNEVTPGLTSVAVPLLPVPKAPGHPEMSSAIAVVYVQGTQSTKRIAQRLRRAAAEIAAALT